MVNFTKTQVDGIKNDVYQWIWLLFETVCFHLWWGWGLLVSSCHFIVSYPLWHRLFWQYTVYTQIYHFCLCNMCLPTLCKCDLIFAFFAQCICGCISLPRANKTSQIFQCNKRFASEQFFQSDSCYLQMSLKLMSWTSCCRLMYFYCFISCA